MTWWQRLDDARTEAGIAKLGDLAQLLGVRQATVSDWKAGRQTPAPDDQARYLELVRDAATPLPAPVRASRDYWRGVAYALTVMTSATNKLARELHESDALGGNVAADVSAATAPQIPPVDARTKRDLQAVERVKASKAAPQSYPAPARRHRSS